jgi:xanthine dehydrogenase accessory factor
LLDKIEASDNAVLATVVGTMGHTYAARGACTLYLIDQPYPLYGNIGSLCVDQELMRHGEAALGDGRSRRVRVDTTTEGDAEVGYGTYCGGVMDVVIEPIVESRKPVFRKLRRHLEDGEDVYLVHDIASGELRVTIEEPHHTDDTVVERMSPPQTLWLFGATPLTRRIVRYLDESPFDVHVIDWRRERLDACQELPTTCRHQDEFAFDPHALVLVASHDFHRDKAVLAAAIDAECAWVGVLSSRTRWERMHDELVAEGHAPAALMRVSCPVGLDIGARDDVGIAVSIIAELVQCARG